jgi:hypothetical protein
MLSTPYRRPRRLSAPRPRTSAIRTPRPTGRLAGGAAMMAAD